MRLLFAACQGDATAVEELLRSGVDVDSIDLDGRTALHIAACEGQGEVVRLLLDWKANINARDRWGSTVRQLYCYYYFIFVTSSLCSSLTNAIGLDH